MLELLELLLELLELLELELELSELLELLELSAAVLLLPPLLPPQATSASIMARAMIRDSTRVNFFMMILLKFSLGVYITRRP